MQSESEGDVPTPLPAGYGNLLDYVAAEIQVRDGLRRVIDLLTKQLNEARARAQRYYMSGIYETAEGESVRREFCPVGPWSAGRYEANAGIEPGRYSHSDRRPDKRDEEANDAERFTVERTAALAEVALLKALLRDMRWHPVDGGLMVVPPGWQQRRDIALGLRKGEADRG